MTIRLARPEDCPALLAIYSQYIHTDITFEYALPSREEFSRRMEEISACYPYLVLEEDGSILGYAYAHRIWERAAYQWDAELSVYLHREATGRGLGKKLCGTLLELLRLQNVHTVYSLVSSPNPASEQLHRTLGFDRLALYEKVGYKNGHWIDVIWFSRQLREFEENPAGLIPFPQLSARQVEELLKQ